MKKQHIIKTVLSLLLLAAVSFGVGCGSVTPVSSEFDLMKDIKANRLSAPGQPDRESAAKAADFGLRLFRAAKADVNTLVSPVSVLFALAMTANGAEGETLTQMEKVLGMSRSEFNDFCRSYAASLPSGDKYKLCLANSIWFTSDDSFTVNEGFLQTNADYYGADIYKAPFDKGTLSDINTWVKKNTDGMIPRILDEIPDDAVMYLVNALAFDAEWQFTYEKYHVNKGDFTTEDGRIVKADFMHHNEGVYLSSGNAEGFIKYYKDRKYAFAALLPNEGVSVAELVDSLDGERLTSILNGAEEAFVQASIPKFEFEYGTELNEALSSMGMPYAFDSEKADFASLGSSAKGNIHIDGVIHKTSVTVDEKGTKAGAAAAVQIGAEAAPIDRMIVLDRPFVFFLIDCETNVPFFIGTLMEP